MKEVSVSPFDSILKVCSSSYFGFKSNHSSLRSLITCNLQSDRPSEGYHVRRHINMCGSKDQIETCPQSGRGLPLSATAFAQVVGVFVTRSEMPM